MNKKSNETAKSDFSKADNDRILEVLENIPDSFAMWDKDLKLVTFNQKYLDLRPDLAHLLKPGLDYEDLVWARAKTGQQADAVGREAEWVAERIELIKQAASDYEFRLGDQWYQISQKKLSDGSVVAFQKNITLQREREHQLSDSEEKYRTLIEFSPDAVYIHDGKKILYANEAAIEIFGARSVDDIIGRDALGHVPPGFKDHVKKRIQGIFDTGISAGRVPQVYIQFDGSRIDVEAQGTRINYKGEQAILVIARDISARVETEKTLKEATDHLEAMVEERTSELQQEVDDRRAVEQALRISEKVTRALLNASDYAAVLIDPTGRILEANDAVFKWFSVERGQGIGANAYELMIKSNKIPQELIEERRARLAEIIKSGKPKQSIDQIGNQYVEVNSYPVIDEEQRVTHVAVFMNDITERIESEDELRRAKEIAELANRSKTEFLANMSHELRSPLTAILGFAESMQQQIFGPVEVPKYMEYLENIVSSGEHLHDLINDILDVSAIESGNLNLNEEVADIEGLIDATLRMVKPRADSAGIILNSSFDISLSDVSLDLRRMKQILVNLLSNAIKFSSDGDEVSLAVNRTEKGSLIFEVVDHGIGMDEDDIELALTKFGQVESDLARNYEGSGLGLPLTNGLVVAHGGTLTIKSKPGEGTVVTVEFPSQRIVD